MHVSHETPAATEDRLRRVLAHAHLEVYPGAYAFYESPLAEGLRLRGDALACVRDEDVWSQLAPSDDPARERFGLFRFHFPEGLDNSGFVGWLATRCKRELGTGLFVVCGQNAGRGGIFDYWGCPLAQRGAVFTLLERLRAA